jgi:D-3-phosphoglycerate dehydrogenase / 2-oxoglutarate reductase
MAHILVLDDIAEEGMQMLQQEPSLTYAIKLKLKGADLREALMHADGAIIRSGVTITAESLEGNRRLKAIVRAGVGTDNIDKSAATRHGIVVMNTPAGNTLSTAEHAFALMLALSRSIHPAYQSLVEHRWDRKKFMGTQLADKTLGIVGMGRIGREVAKRAIAFQMKVIGYDPFLTDDQAAQLGIERTPTVDAMLPRLDYLTVHTPLTPETQDLIGTSQLDRLKPGVRLINAARGGIYNEAALVDGLKRGIIGGVALDVFATEPCENSPLFGMPGVVCTPHLGASTEEAQTQVAIEGVQLLINFFKTGEIRHAVNVASIDPQTLADLRGHLNVAYRLGKLLAQWHGGAIDSVRLNYRGQVAGKDTRLLSSAFCAGLMEDALVEEVNIVNAEWLLKERGIALASESNTSTGAFASSITAEVSGAGQTAQAGGALLGHDMPRLVLLDDYRLEAFLDGTLLVFTHRDVPGIIGKVGTVFGAHRVNIAQMAVGRQGSRPGGAAIGVLNLDSVPQPEAVQEVTGVDGVDRARVIQLPAAGQPPAWLG